jgi:nitric oxide dioxygenase
MLFGDGVFDILKEWELEIRTQLEAQTGGWNGWRTFRIEAKIRESSVGTSFVLRPVDGRPVIRQKPEQYLTIRLPIAPGETVKRNYSISSAPNNETYRISVKREVNGQGASKYLHDRKEVGALLEVTPPAGDFYLPEEFSVRSCCCRVVSD